MSNFLQFGVLDELHVFIAPIIIGNGISAFNSIESNLLRDSYTFSNQAVLKSDEDLHIIYTKNISMYINKKGYDNISLNR